MRNFTKYLGIPYVSHGRDFEGMDCLGLVIQIYKDFLGVELPDISEGYDDALAKKQVKSCIEDYPVNDLYTSIPLDAPRQEFDVLVFKICGLPCHIGLHVHSNQMLHQLGGSLSTIEAYDGMKWKDRLVEVRRHVTLC